MAITIDEIRFLRAEADRLGLYGRDILNNYTDEQLAKIYNGVGPAWMHEETREKFTKYHARGKAPSVIHDVRYEESDHTRGSFYRANIELEDNWVISGDDAYSWYNPLRYFERFRAHSFRKMCDFGGWTSWIAPPILSRSPASV